MTSLQDSVGRGGVNRPEDVRTVQRLLSGRPGIGRVDVDGRVGPQTVGAVETFQRDVVGLRWPGGRVDPGGRTFRALSDRGPVASSAAPAAGHAVGHGAGSAARSAVAPGSPAGPMPGGAGADPRSGSTANTAASTAGTPPTAPSTPEQREERRRFVRGAVKETALTTRILDAIQPHFSGVRATVISGYLNDTDLIWKVNYHWDYLLWMLDHSAELPVEASVAGQLRSLASTLRSCPPNPSSGYRNSPVGVPEDRSSVEELDRRHRALRQAKQEFGTLVQRHGLSRLSRRSTQCFDLAAAPVAHPGTSKHGSGYALDIEGDNPSIRDICTRLGASTVFDEKSHVHVEFANGVRGS